MKRIKLDAAASVIQRHIRGFLVRMVLKRHTAAVGIQRHVVGMVTRKKLWKLNNSAVALQRTYRGYLAREAVKDLRIEMTRVVIVIQCHVRSFIAKGRVARLREERLKADIRLHAIIDLQRVWRGKKGRQKALARQAEYNREVEMHAAATKLQSIQRRQRAKKRVKSIRAQKLEGMNKAATFVRKLWLMHTTRSRYLNLKKEFQINIEAIITIQRYVRGFSVRLRMWREAVRAEEELWGVVEIQRMWRGYCGRMSWLASYENMWRREMAAARLQRHARGWVARTRINTTKRKLARAQFERARARFRAAQTIQRVVRGLLSRKVTHAWSTRIISTVVHIQRIARGHLLRKNMWAQVIEQRSVMIQAMIRGFLVRRRLMLVVAKVIMIQKKYRLHRSKPKNFRRKKFVEMQERKKSAKHIQKSYKNHLQKKEIARIQDERRSLLP